jgi:hypothetical protein
VDLGTINWDYDSVEKRFLTNKIPFKQVGSSITPNLLNELYIPVHYYAFYDDRTLDKTMAVTSDYFYIRDLSYTDVNAFKSAMSGVILVYEIATPEVVDIELPNIISIEPEGVIEFVNEYNYDINSTLEFYYDKKNRIHIDEVIGNLSGTAKKAEFAERDS